MTTLTLQVTNPSILPSLKKVLGALEGVTIAKPSSKGRCNSETDYLMSSDKMTEIIKKGMNDIEHGNYTIVNIDEL